MLRCTLLLALAAGLRAAKTTSRSIPRGTQANLLSPVSNGLKLSLASDCYSFETDCDGYCMDATNVCCGDGDGGSCDAGYYCTLEGCCPEGEICTGAPTGCSDGKELCGEYCIPEGSVCCSDGVGYCLEGDTCTSDGECTTGGSSDDDDIYEGGFGDSTPTTASEAASEPTDSFSEPTSSFLGLTETSTTGTMASASAAGDGSTLCRRKKGGFSGGGGGGGGGDFDDDDDNGGDGGSDDACGGGASAATGFTIPTVLAGVGAMVALFL